MSKDCTSNVELRKCTNCGKQGHLAWQCRASSIKEVEEPEDEEANAISSSISGAHMGWGGLFQLEEETFNKQEICALGEWEGLPEYINEVVRVAIADNVKASAGSGAKTRGCNSTSSPEDKWEVLATSEASWRKKIPGGYRITFLQDSGAVRTIATKDMIPGMNVYRTKNTGSSFRVANGNFIPNLGEVKLDGKSTNGNGMCIKAQVADVTRPLAATAEVVDAGNIVINHKGGGIIKQVTEDQLDRIMRAIHNEPGLEIPVYRKRNTFLIDVDVADPVGGGVKGSAKDQGEGFQKAKKTFKPKPTPMDVGRIGVSQNTWAVLGDDSGVCMPCGQTFPGPAW